MKRRQKDVDKLRRELIKISIFSAPVVSLIVPLKRVQAITEPGGADLPAPRLEKFKIKRERDRRRIFEKSPFEKSPFKRPDRTPAKLNLRRGWEEPSKDLGED